MANKRDYYEVLGVAKTATLDDIKKAYRKKAMENHPDRNPGDKAAEERFKEATEAYEILSDDNKRKMYDTYGFDAVQGAAGAGNYQNVYRDFGDIFDGMDLGEIFSQFFGGGSSRRYSSARQSGYYGEKPQGDSLRYDVAVSLKDAVKGAKVEISYSHYVSCPSCSGTGAKKGTGTKKCPTCNGSGYSVRSNGFFQMRSTCHQCSGTGEILESPCPDCSGEGVIHKKEKVVVDIPEGVADGSRVRLKGMGNAVQNGTPGDLYVYIKVKEDDCFKRINNDLYCKLPINIVQATLGGRVEFKNITGETIAIDIPKGSETDKLLRIKGKGITPNGNKFFTSKGDLFVRLYVETPKNLSKSAEECIKKLSELTELSTNTKTSAINN